MTVTLLAPAKINPALDVVGKRADGYHLLNMIMQTISLHDQVRVSRAATTELTCNRADVPTDDGNICIKAWQAMQAAYNLPGGVRIEIEKNIPVAAGMAGGSTNGAATILGINEEFRLRLSTDEMKKTAATLGADVPYCIQQGTAQAQGIGDELTTLPRCPQLFVLAVNAGFAVSTVQVYKNLQWDKVEHHPDVPAMIDAIRKNDAAGVLANLGNVLESSAFRLFPQLAATKERIAGLGLNAIMSGSGGTMLGLTADQELANYALKKLETDFPFAGVFTTQ